ncbi:hypothetical protein GOP47_0016990 [Adiantum capillus-veneris]|uniref:Uncharacterized protein n=1 Tax=Adiantum capillus-veneris TaxID=13818 RepID=A0A9D4UIS4_ADICA|nr:hypothetical protein GOP47_0016990 [Adiantum capillus-veneris]
MKHGEGNWKEVAQRSGLRRCGKSCRLRWTNQLRPHLRKDRFSPSEEATILLLHSIHGNKWAKISAQLPGRTDNSIKNFMNTRAKRQKRQAAAPATILSTRASAPNISSTSFTGSQAASANSSSTVACCSSRAHPNYSSSYHALMMAANNRMNHVAAPGSTSTVLSWPLESTVARAASSRGTTTSSFLLRTDLVASEAMQPVMGQGHVPDDLIAMLSAAANDVYPAATNIAVSAGVGGTSDQQFDSLAIDDQLPAAHDEAALYSPLIDRLQQLPSIRPYISTCNNVNIAAAAGNSIIRAGISPSPSFTITSSSAFQLPSLQQAEHAVLGQFHSISQHNEISCHHEHTIQRPELPSVQCNKPSASSSFADPLALLGGESVSLLKLDAENLGSATCFSPSIVERHEQSAEDDAHDDGLIAGSLISSYSQQLETSCCTTSSSSTHSQLYHDYTLECIIKPLLHQPRRRS